MPGSADIRGIAVKLLKSHRLRYIDMRTVKDPLTGTDVIVLKFRRDKDASPKAFFDDLNENGIQYKKLVKDPDATQIVCELWPKGQKRQVSELRDKARDKARAQKNQGSEPGSTGNLSYVGIPSGQAQSTMITSLARDIRQAGCAEESEELLRLAGGQDWDEFRRKMEKVFRKLKLHARPEVRQLREALSTAILKEMGADAELLKGMRGSDLEKRLNECVTDHIDLIIDTRGLANSILRRVASAALVPSQKIAQLQGLRRGFMTLAARAQTAREPKVERQALRCAASLYRDIQILAEGGTQIQTNLESPLMEMVSSRNLDAAFLHIIESVSNG